MCIVWTAVLQGKPYLQSKNWERRLLRVRDWENSLGVIVFPSLQPQPHKIAQLQQQCWLGMFLKLKGKFFVWSEVQLEEYRANLCCSFLSSVFSLLDSHSNCVVAWGNKSVRLLARWQKAPEHDSVGEDTREGTSREWSRSILCEVLVSHRSLRMSYSIEHVVPVPDWKLDGVKMGLLQKAPWILEN